MCNLEQIEHAIRDSLELRESIVRSIGSSTVALFAVFNSNRSELLKLAGTGTLVTDEDYHYILTAAHVWEESLKSAASLGITRSDNITHRYLIDIHNLVPTIVKPDASKWNEWGPDLALLKIPSVLVGEIEAIQVFEHLKAPPKRLIAEGLECWVAMGTPAELGTFTENYADVQISGDFVNQQRLYRGDHDYWDFAVDTAQHGAPKNFGGYSGGGLWRVVVYCSSETGKIDWSQRLKGLIFWQFPIVNDHRIIRAHGPKSIIGNLLQSKGIYEEIEAAYSANVVISQKTD
jgi:trypsin